MTVPIELDELESDFKAAVLEKVPAAKFDLCLTCGTCTGGCPASELFDMDPRKLVRMLVLGLDDEVKKTPWAWVCTMCARCVKQCPMEIDIPKLVYNMRGSWPRDKRPKGILGSCDQHIRSGNAMGVPSKDFTWTVEDVAEEIRENQPLFKDMQVTVGPQGCLHGH
jgi:Fe-S oxidoreductase